MDMRKRLSHRNMNFMNGGREQETGAMWHVPKKDLLAGVQALLEQGSYGCRVGWRRLDL